jgi:hypothetical protein
LPLTSAAMSANVVMHKIAPIKSNLLVIGFV